jgi:hypothetical protein
VRAHEAMANVGGGRGCFCGARRSGVVAEPAARAPSPTGAGAKGSRRGSPRPRASVPSTNPRVRKTDGVKTRSTSVHLPIDLAKKLARALRGERPKAERSDRQGRPGDAGRLSGRAPCSSPPIHRWRAVWVPENLAGRFRKLWPVVARRRGRRGRHAWSGWRDRRVGAPGRARGVGRRWPRRGRGRGARRPRP